MSSYIGVQFVGTEVGHKPDSRTKCPHCRKDSTHGTHCGCHDCGRVKTTPNGRRPAVTR